MSPQAVDPNSKKENEIRVNEDVIGLRTLFNVITKLGLRGFLTSAERRLISLCSMDHIA